MSEKKEQFSSSSSRLTSLLPTNLQGGLQGGLQKGGGLQGGLKSSSKTTDNNDMPPPPQRSKLGLDRNYRLRMDETPSHGGGVNREAQLKIRQKERERERRRHRYDSDSSEEYKKKKSKKKKRYRSRSRSRSRSKSPSPRRRDRDRSDDRRSEKLGRDRDRESYSSSQRRDRSSRRDYDRDRRYDSSSRSSSSRYRDDRYVTPSTHASTSTRRDQSEYTRRRQDVAYAQTPMMDSRSNDRNRSYSNHHRSNRDTNSNAWENETPLYNRKSDADDIAQRAVTSVRAFPGGGGATATPMIRSQHSRKPNIVPEQDDEEFDREFYLADDEEFVQDGNDNMGRFLYESAKTKAREKEMQQQREKNVNPLRNAKRNALMDDQEAWENSRLLSSGAAVRGNVDLDFGSEEETRVTLLVHQVKPPFLGKGASAFSRIRNAVPTVKDNTSDFAKMAREGSVTLARLREKKEKNTMRNKFWQIGGSRMGSAMGVKEKETEDGDKSKNIVQGETKKSDAAPEENADGEIDYKKSSGFASHMNKDGEKSEAVSEFAKKKSIRQQREYLPAFTVRDDLLNVVRENNVIVVVGETGSGKTTQLTQYLMEEGYCEYGMVGCKFIWVLPQQSKQTIIN